MRIAFLIGEIHPNAGQTYDIAEIIKYILSSNSDWYISILTNKISYPLVDGIDNSRVKLIKLSQYYTAILFKKKISTMLKKYDLVYVKGNYPYVFPSEKSLKPMILVLHQMDSPLFVHGLKSKFKTILANLLTGYIIRKVDTIVTVSEELSAFYKTKFGKELITIEDQISDIYFTNGNRKSMEKEKQIKLLTVGNWDGHGGRKRHDILIQYFANATRKIPNLRLSMVGLSDQNIKVLSDISKQLMVNESVELKGFLNDYELAQEYVNNHIYTTATTYEGFYRQVVEAFATGMPALVYDSRKTVEDFSKSASANHILKSGAGELYDNPESFFDSLLKISKRYEEYSTKAKVYAKKFSMENLGKKTEDLIKNTVKGNHR